MTERPPEMMTPEEAEVWGTGVVGAMYDDDEDTLRRLLTDGCEFNAANVRLMLTVLTAAIGIVMRRLTSTESQFAALEFADDDTPEAGVHAGRIIATGINEDHDVQQDLITALLTRADELAETNGERAGAMLLSDVLLTVVGLLRAMIAEHQQGEP